MIRILALALALLAGPVLACTPASPTAVRTGYFAGGNSALWAYWFCTDTGKVTAEVRVLPVAAITPTLLASIRGYADGANPSFAGTAPVLPATDPTIAPAFAAAMAAAAADPAKPVSTAEVWKAAGTGTLYATANGKLTSVIAGRKATIGALLDCAIKTVSGSSTYCPLAGGAAGEVTLARKVTP